MISVVLTTHNRAHLLKEAIDSVLAQTCKDIELIVVDDGSTDDTEQIADLYRGQIRYLKQSQSGPSKARNTGIKLAQGEYVAFIDDDDIYNPGKLALQLECFKHFPQVGFVFSDMTALTSDGQTIHFYMRKYFGVLERLSLRFENIFEHYEPLESFISIPLDPVWEEKKFYWGNIFQTLLLGNFVLQSTFMARKEALLSVGGYNEDIIVAEDVDLFLRMSRKWIGGFLEIPLILYRLTPHSLSRRKEFYLKLWTNTLQSLMDILKDEIDWDYKNDPKIRSRLSFIHHKIAYFQAKEGALNDAYSHWVESIRNCPSNWKPYFGLMLGWLLPLLSKSRATPEPFTK